MFKTHAAAWMLMGICVALAGPANAAVEYDQNVTSNAIFGSGNANGSFTTDRANGVELGLRGKLRHNAIGAAENTFNSNGDGTYTFSPGVATTQAFPTAVWSFEWSINTDFNGTTSFNLADLTYELKMTSTTGAAIAPFDPIHAAHPNGYWDHSIGTNSTATGAGVEASGSSSYATLLAANNLAQNSWKPSWFATSFDPTLPGTYILSLTAFLDEEEVASTSIEVLTPEPASIALLACGGLAMFRRRRSTDGAC